MLDRSGSTTRLRQSLAAARKTITVCAVGLAGISTAAFAADIPPVTKALSPIITSASWAGFYLGAHGGYGWGKNDYFQVGNPLTHEGVGNLNSRGAVYGGQAGYNWQYGRVVTGAEIDFSVADIKSGSSLLSGFLPGQGAFAASFSENTKYLGTARARLGWLPADNLLVYGTAGLAWERMEEFVSQTVGPPTNASIFQTAPFDRFGWVAGAGVETMLPGSNWIGRLEYLHYDFGSIHQAQTIVTNVANGSSIDRPGSQTFDIVRVALSYKFGTPAAGSGAAYAKALPMAIASSWAGFYLGAHGGYGWGANNFSQLVSIGPAVNIGGINLKGGVYGGQAGYNWQFDRAVGGFELDFSGTGMRGDAQARFAVPPASNTMSATDKIAYLGSARARLGWLPTDNIMLYGTAGLGWERRDRTFVNNETVPAGNLTRVDTTSTDHFGWVAGVGAEFMLGGTNWVGRIEYLHYDFGKVATAGGIAFPAGSGTNHAGNHHLDILRAGVSYKFGEPAAVAPVRYAKAPPLAPLSSWAGYYLGAHGGYGWKDNDFTQTMRQNPVRQTGGIRSDGWVAGGHAGYNWQYDRVVTGFEADFSLADLRGTSAAVVRSRLYDRNRDPQRQGQISRHGARAPGLGAL